MCSLTPDWSCTQEAGRAIILNFVAWSFYLLTGLDLQRQAGRGPGCEKSRARFTQQPTKDNNIAIRALFVAAREAYPVGDRVMRVSSNREPTRTWGWGITSYLSYGISRLCAAVPSS